MIQALRQRHSRLAGHLAALWFVLFVACSLAHVGSHVHLDQQVNGESVSILGLAEAAKYLQTTDCHGSADSGALDKSCSAMQNSPLTQLLMMLALVALIALPGLFSLPARLIGRLQQFVHIAYPGFPPPLYLQLQRFNE